MAVITPPQPVVSFVYERWPHHSAWSGYSRFVDYLGGAVRARHIPPTLPPRFVLDLSERRLGHSINRERLGRDLSALRRMAFGSGEVVHLLYGEFDLHYAGRLRWLRNLRGNRLVSTFHLPPARLVCPQSDFERIDVAVALGSHLADYLRGIVGAAHVVQASHGVDVRAWRPDRSCRSSTPTCVFVGSHMRDFSLLEDVIRIVVDDSPAVRFEIVTDPDHVRSLSALPNVHARSGISDAELRGLYRRAWVHVLPLIDCVANNALLEGMATGLPTVTTAVGDVFDYTSDACAICVADGDKTGMAEAVLGLLTDAGRRETLGRAAREIAETMRLEAVARRHADIYLEVADRRRPTSHLRSQRAKIGA